MPGCLQWGAVNWETSLLDWLDCHHGTPCHALRKLYPSCKEHCNHGCCQSHDFWFRRPFSSYDCSKQLMLAFEDCTLRRQASVISRWPCSLCSYSNWGWEGAPSPWLAKSPWLLQFEACDWFISNAMMGTYVRFVTGGIGSHAHAGLSLVWL